MNLSLFPKTALNQGSGRFFCIFSPVSRHTSLEVKSMKLDRKQYKELYTSLTPPSPSHKTVPMAFLVGGGICLLGQVLKTIYLALELEEKAAGSAVSITLVGLGVLLTGLGLFEKIAKRAGAGTLVPITGFSNAIAAPAMEFKSEGWVLGACVKMFSIAGPVLAFGISASVVYGLILWAMETGL